MNLLIGTLLSVVVSAQMDSATIVVGDQTRLHVEAVATAGEQVTLPVLGEAVVPELEIVERSNVQTTTGEDGRVTYSQDYVVTSFSDTLLYVESLPFVVNGDTVRSAGMSLNVINPFEMDDTPAIMDIKDVMSPRIWWWGILRWFLLALGIAGACLGSIFLYLWYKQRAKKAAEPVVNPELLRPCDEVALEKLDAIREAKVWLRGEHKQYFSELTFVIREYIGRRYDVQSNEKTSDETLSAMKDILRQSDQRDLYMQLEKMLRLADLVKFAKWQPTPNENEDALRSAYTFVNETKVVETATDEKNESAKAANSNKDEILGE